MKKIVFLIICGFFLCCNNNRLKKPSKPDNLIKEGEMVAVLYDMAIINAAKGTNKKMLQRKGLNPEKFVFEKHNIDSLQFATSNDYYSYYPELYESIYDKVKFRLEQKKKGYQDILDKEKRDRDSLNKIAIKKRDSLYKKDGKKEKGMPFLLKEKDSKKN